MEQPPAINRNGVLLYNRQRTVRFDVQRLRAFAEWALKPCLEHPGPSHAVLPELLTVEISLVSDPVIARMHRQFLNVPGATDVITFAHGELIISAATAARQAEAHGQPLESELARYIVHGLLHLNGHEDDQPEAAAEMWRVQESLMASLPLEDATEEGRSR
jgi:probable rRNA maturation factor